MGSLDVNRSTMRMREVMKKIEDDVYSDWRCWTERSNVISVGRVLGLGFRVRRD